MPEIENIVTRYVQSENTDYALLIHGPWGSGKTYYLKNGLFSVIKRVKRDEKHCYQPLYISLNGISSYEDISNQILFSRLGLTASISSSFGLVKSLIEISSAVPVPAVKAISAALRSIGGMAARTASRTLSLSNCVLCFDDLERLDNKLLAHSVLGYINTNYLEHNHIKTIFVCNETEVSKRDPSYGYMKEKVVGRVVNFRQDIGDILSDFIANRYGTNGQYRRYLEQIKSDIVRLLLANNVNNLRILGFALDAFETVFSYCDSKSSREHLKDMLVFILLISIEYRESRLTVDDHSDVKDLDDLETRYHMWSTLHDEKDGEEVPYNVQFFEKYVKDRNVKFIFYQSLYVFLLTGYITKSLLEKNLLELDARKAAEWDTAYARLSDFRELEEPELQETVRMVLDYVTKGAYIPREYLNIHSIVNWIAGRGYIQDIPKDFYETIKSGLVKSLERTAEEHPEVSDTSIWDHYMSESVDEKYKELVRIVKDFLQQQQSVMQRKQVADLLDSLDKPDTEFTQILYEMDKRSLFATLDSPENIDLLCGLTNRGIYRMEAILHREIVRISNAGDIFHDQAPHLRNIASEITLRLSSRKVDNMRNLRLGDLTAKLQESADHIERTRSV